MVYTLSQILNLNLKVGWPAWIDIIFLIVEVAEFGGDIAWFQNDLSMLLFGIVIAVLRALFSNNFSKSQKLALNLKFVMGVVRSKPQAVL